MKQIFLIFIFIISGCSVKRELKPPTQTELEVIATFDLNEKFNYEKCIAGGWATHTICISEIVNLRLKRFTPPAPAPGMNPATAAALGAAAGYMLAPKKGKQ